MASNDTLAYFFSPSGQQETHNSARGVFSAELGNLFVLNFDDTNDEVIHFTGMIPKSYQNNGITVYIHWFSSDVVSGDVVWAVSLKKIGANLTSNEFSEPVISASNVSNKKNSKVVTAVSLKHGNQMNSLSGGEFFKMAISRLASSNADTMVGDARLIAVEIREN